MRFGEGGRSTRRLEEETGDKLAKAFGKYEKEAPLSERLERSSEEIGADLAAEVYMDQWRGRIAAVSQKTEQATRGVKNSLEKGESGDFFSVGEGIKKEAESKEEMMTSLFLRLQALAAKRDGLELKLKDRNLSTTEGIITISEIRKIEDERNLTDKFLTGELAAYNARKEEARRLAELAAEKEDNEGATSLKKLLTLGEERKRYWNDEVGRDIDVLSGRTPREEYEDRGGRKAHEAFVDEQSGAIEGSESIMRMNEAALLVERQQIERVSLWGKLKGLFRRKKEVTDISGFTSEKEQQWYAKGDKMKGIKGKVEKRTHGVDWDVVQKELGNNKEEIKKAA